MTTTAHAPLAIAAATLLDALATAQDADEARLSVCLARMELFTSSDWTKSREEAAVAVLAAIDAIAPTQPVVKTDAEPETGMDQLRRLVGSFDSCNEDFNCQWTPEQLLQIQRMWDASAWDIYPDDWTTEQLGDALVGIPPRWTHNEVPVGQSIVRALRGATAIPSDTLREAADTWRAFANVTSP